MSNAVNLVGFAWRSPLLPPNVLMLPVNPHQRKLPPTQNLNNYHRIDSDELDQLIYLNRLKKNNSNFINTSEPTYQFVALKKFWFFFEGLNPLTKMMKLFHPLLVSSFLSFLLSICPQIPL